MESCLTPCSERSRMERLEDKIDRIHDMLSQSREMIVRLEGLPEKVEQHDRQIIQLIIQSEIATSFATKKQLNVTISIALLSIVASASPLLFKLLMSLFKAINVGS